MSQTDQGVHMHVPALLGTVTAAVSLLILNQKAALNKEHPLQPPLVSGHHWLWRQGVLYSSGFSANHQKNLLGAEVLYSLMTPQYKGRNNNSHSIKEKDFVEDIRVSFYMCT